MENLHKHHKKDPQTVDTNNTGQTVDRNLISISVTTIIQGKF